MRHERLSRPSRADGRPLADAIEVQLEQLSQFSLPKLRSAWGQRFGSNAPAIRSRDMFLRMLAWKIQEEVHGGLDADTRRALLSIAAALERDGDYHPKIRHDLSPGVVLTREWKGVVHSVTVTAGGFQHLGKRYKSLSVRYRAHDCWDPLVRSPFLWTRTEGRPAIAAGSTMSGKRPIRCAIYTRKSTEEGLEQEFNSLDAQREACEAYVASQKAEGWSARMDRYDDGGFSGGTLERPALQRLLNDIGTGTVDVVVVYKIDRLSRSLMDFTKLVEVFDRKSVTFVSVTQSFNTTTSMGRLTLRV